jgi:hypothetical protein
MGAKVMRPTAATVAAEDPEIAPNTTQVPTVVIGRLALVPPRSDLVQSTKRREMPPNPMISPAKMKNGTASSAELSRVPNMTCCNAVGGIE